MSKSIFIKKLTQGLPIFIEGTSQKAAAKLACEFKVTASVVELFPAKYMDELISLANKLEKSKITIKEALNILEQKVKSLEMASSNASNAVKSNRLPLLTTNKLNKTIIEGSKNKDVTIAQADALRHKGFITNYKDNRAADVLRLKDNFSFAKNLNLKYQADGKFVQPTKALNEYPSITKEAQKASNDFAKTSKTGFNSLPDGFRFRGSTSCRFDAKGKPNKFKARQEGILIDLKSDKTLNKVINNFEQKIKGTNLSEEQKLEMMMQYTDDVFSASGSHSKLVKKFSQEKVYKLGDIIDSGAGLCRHKSLLTKLLGDRVGVKISCVSGEYKGYGHMWTEASLSNGKKILADPMHRAVINISNPTKMHSKALDYFIEIGNSGKLKRCYGN